MADLFSKTEVNFGGAMTSQFGMLMDQGGGLSGVLMQNLQLQYSQAVSRIYEIGRAGQKTHVYYIGGRAQGTMGAAHILGPGVSMKDFYDRFSDVCNANGNDLSFSVGPNICAGSTLPAGQPGPEQTAKMTYTAKFVVLTSIGVSVAAQDFVINESAQLMFSGLEFTG